MSTATKVARQLNGRQLPTSEQFRAYEAMFAHFNRELWKGRLPPVLLNFSRHTGTLGFFAPERWQKGETAGGARMHEISINPAFLLTLPPREVASTLVLRWCITGSRTSAHRRGAVTTTGDGPRR
jgi:hypothetical protein